MPQPIAYLNGRFVSRQSLAVPVGDAGFMLGATVAEQMRSFGGRLFHPQAHLERLGRSLEIVDINPGLSLKRIGALAEELVARNHPLLAEGDDLGLTIFITPGALHEAAATPTVCLHTQPVDFSQYADQYEQGVPVFVTDVVQVPDASWPAALKCRSRMHYYLADRRAAALSPGARGLIVDGLGNVLEATTANLVAYLPGEGLVSPPLEKVMPGISLAELKQLSVAAGISFKHRDLPAEEVRSAGELMLTSTSPCVLPVTRVDGRPLGDGRPGPVFRQLLADWSAAVGLDIAAQARQFAAR